MKLTEITWKQLGASLKKNVHELGRSLAYIAGIILTVIAILVIKALNCIWKQVDKVWRKLTRAIDRNPRTSVVVVLVMMAVVILTMFLNGRIGEVKAEKKIDSLMMANDTLKNYSSYDNGYLDGYRHGKKDSMMYRVEYK